MGSRRRTSRAGSSSTPARLKPIVVAQQTKAGVTIVRPMVDAMKQTIREHRIGLVIIDPFVSCHSVVENDNGAINDVATVWAQIADETGCGVELIHHSRKTGGAEVTVEDGRGAVALSNKSRSARALNAMTEEEAEEAEVQNRRLFFRHYAGKSNLAPPSDDSTWVTLKSVSLDNAGGNRPPDEVGVARAWEWPSSLRDVGVKDLREVQQRVSKGRFREDHGTVRSGTSPRAIAALRNTMLAIVHDAAEPLPKIREIFAQNRIKAIAAAQKGSL